MEKILVLDSETTNSLDDALTYDIGFMVCDINGKVYEKHSFVIADIFLDKELMNVAYFVEKIPQYWADIKSGKRILTSFNNVKWTLRHIMKKHNITKVFAYNCRFDYMALATTQRYLTSSKWRYVLPYGTEFHDILALSRHILAKNEDYKKFCVENGYLTSHNRPQVSAEVVARYFFDKDFEECHTAIEDCEIEFEILKKCWELDGFNYETKMW